MIIIVCEDDKHEYLNVESSNTSGDKNKWQQCKYCGLIKDQKAQECDATDAK